MKYLDLVPPALRHAVIAFMGAFAFTVEQAVRQYHGIVGVGLPWHDTLISATNAGSLTAAAGVGLAAVTPLTGQYGFFKTKNPDTGNGPTPLDPPADTPIPPLPTDIPDSPAS